MDKTTELGVLFISSRSRKHMNRVFGDNNLEFHPLFDSKPYVFIHKSHPLAKEVLTIEELHPYPCIMYELDSDAPSVLQEEMLVPDFYPQKVTIVNGLYQSLMVMQQCQGYDLGTGFSKEAVESRGKGTVFFEHICRVIEIARRHGAEKILLFGDAVHKYPELMDRLPENVAVIDWNYNAEEHYPSLLEYPPLGREFWAAGGVSTWNSIFPRVYNSYVNLSGYSAGAKQLGADGFLVTDWGDYGHMQPLGLSLYGYLFGAVHTFGPADQTPETFEKHAWPLIFPDSRVAGAFRALMDSNLAPNIQTGFKTMTIYYFFDDMLNGLAMHGNERYPKISREAFAVLKEKGQQALELLEATREDAARWDYPDSHWKALFGENLVSELTLAAKMTCFIAEKGELAYRILERLDDPHCSGDEMLDMICQIRAQYQTFQLLRDEFITVWMKRARRIGIETSLSLFDRAGAQMGKTAAWLAEQRKAWLDHGTADVPYTAAEHYGVLWTSDFQNMWDRAYPWQ